MANHKSAAKKARRDVEVRLRNRSNRSTLKTAVKGFLSLIAGGDKSEAAKQLPLTPGLGGQSLPQGRDAQERRRPHQVPPGRESEQAGLTDNRNRCEDPPGGSFLFFRPLGCWGLFMEVAR